VDWDSTPIVRTYRETREAGRTNGLKVQGRVCLPNSRSPRV